MMGTYYGNDETITLLTTNTLRRLSSSLFGPSHTCLGLSSRKLEIINMWEHL